MATALNKTPPTILLRERQPHLATLSSAAGKTVQPFYSTQLYRKRQPASNASQPPLSAMIFGLPPATNNCELCPARQNPAGDQRQGRSRCA